MPCRISSKGLQGHTGGEAGARPPAGPRGGGRAVTRRWWQLVPLGGVGGGRVGAGRRPGAARVRAARTTRPVIVLLMGLLVRVMAACGGTGSGGSVKSMTLYTCASANVEQAVIKGFEAAHPGTTRNVFRAPTGQLNARVAADVRSGGIQADVIWACDPLTMYGYDSQKLLRAWRPPNASGYRAPTARHTSSASICSPWWWWCTRAHRFLLPGPT